MTSAQPKGLSIRVLLAFALGLAIFELAIFATDWGVLGLNLYIGALFYVKRPPRILHPSTMVFFFYGLWIVIPSTLDLLLVVTDWEYVLPAGRPHDWSQLEPVTLLQVQISITVLVFATRLGAGIRRVEFINHDTKQMIRAGLSSVQIPYLLICSCLALVMIYLQMSGGIGNWISNYSYSYLTQRRGLGVLNFFIRFLGALTLYKLGLVYFARRVPQALIWAAICIAGLGFMGGFKSRIMILSLVFFVPHLSDIRPNTTRLLKYTVGFFVTLYFLTLVRANGYYSGFSRYVEMIGAYFNSYPLHDLIVESRDPGYFTTLDYVLTKPAQLFGLRDANAEFDISVMLTKEYFPTQWFTFSATQQWPIETEMYLNFGGPLLQVIPLGIYGAILGRLYRAAMLEGNLALVPIYVFEMIRIISTLRGTLLPWQLPVTLVQYLALYFACKNLNYFRNTVEGVRKTPITI